MRSLLETAAPPTCPFLHPQFSSPVSNLPLGSSQKESSTNLIAHSSPLWEHQFSKTNSRLPDCVHRNTEGALWINGGKFPWAEAQLSDLTLGTAQSGYRNRSSLLREPDVKSDKNAKRERAISPTFSFEEKQLHEAVEALNIVEQREGSVSTNVLVHLLQRCINKADLVAGRKVHGFIIRNDLESDTYLGSYLIRMFASCGSLEESNELFCKMSEPNVFAWSAIISANSTLGKEKQAIKLYHQFLQSSVNPDGHLFVGVLKGCSSVEALDQGRLVHTHIVERGLDLDAFVISALITMYAKCGSVKDAHKIFCESSKQSVVTWNAMIAGYVQHGHCPEAFELFEEMVTRKVGPNHVTFLSVLKACSMAISLVQGKLIHDHIIETGFDLDLSTTNALIDMYAKCGSLHDAHSVFDDSPKRDVVTWTTMIAGYAEKGYGKTAFSLFNEMIQEGMESNLVTFLNVLKACSALAELDQGKLIHDRIIEKGLQSNAFVVSSLIDMYMKCGSIQSAHRVFINSPKQDVVTWTAMIGGYAQRGHGQEALQLFQQMQQNGLEANEVTVVNILKACSCVGALDPGKWIHSYIIKEGLDSVMSVINALIDMYNKCGSLQDGHSVFDESSKHDVVTWNTVIAGYAQYELGQEALQLFHEMQQKGVKPDQTTLVSILKACSCMAALNQAKLTHYSIIERGLELDVFVLNTLIDVYGKCGSFQDAQRMFDRSLDRDVVTWSAIIAVCAKSSHYQLAVEYFEGMQRVGLKPNNVTFVSLLSACSHMGLVDEGFSHFKSMNCLGIAPTYDHYNCIAELLGHVGYLFEAEDLLVTIPAQSNRVGWMSLLSHCKRLVNVELGRRCFDHLARMDCRSAAGYVLMSDIYSLAGMREDAVGIEHLRKHAKAWKKPGTAFIEVNNLVHSFSVGGSIHPLSKSIYVKLKELNVQMKAEGYVPHLGLVLKYASDQEKEDALCGHCEKQAIAFGLLTTAKGTTIRISKNLRMCTDCHNAAKLITKIEKREIIVIDEYCVHHFKDERCSCKD